MTLIELIHADACGAKIKKSASIRSISVICVP